ncbi:MAG: RimK family alpha-L-glutamate ligase [Bacteroidetes bacterium]|nr:RimK family alpha-L-glutamate ligase [Bacteroidota bacterium]
MLNGWIISDTKPGEGYFSIEDLSALQKLPFKLDFINMADIDLEVADDQLTLIHVQGEYRPLPDFALCMFEQEVCYFHFALLRQLEMLGVFSLHKAKNIARSLDKFHSYQKLLRAWIPVAKTIMVNANSRLDWIVERIGFPMVLKVPDGSKGEGVCLVRNRPELQNIQDLYCKNIGRNLLAQEFIATSKGRDARITMCDGEVVFGVLRDNSAGEDFRSNISVGGNGVWWEPDDEAVRIAKAVVKVMDMKLCGVDLLFGENGYIVGEINSMPGCLHVLHQGKSNLQRLLEAIYRAVVKYTGHDR